MSDIVHYNVAEVKNKNMVYDNIEDVIMGNIETRNYYPGIGMYLQYDSVNVNASIRLLVIFTCIL